MKSKVLVAAPAVLARRLEGQLDEVYDVEVASDPERAAALVDVGTYRAIVVLRGFVRHQVRFVLVDGADDPALMNRVTAAVTSHREQEFAEGQLFASYAQFTYDELMTRIRTRETRRYLIALLVQHHGSVTHAARAAGIVRESLHRLLRKHDLDAETFRAKE
jgi:transcriptional regulator with AAA-type ATPase domain